MLRGAAAAAAALQRSLLVHIYSKSMQRNHLLILASFRAIFDARSSLLTFLPHQTRSEPSYLSYSFSSSLLPDCRCCIDSMKCYKSYSLLACLISSLFFVFFHFLQRDTVPATSLLTKRKTHVISLLPCKEQFKRIYFNTWMTKMKQTITECCAVSIRVNIRGAHEEDIILASYQA